MGSSNLPAEELAAIALESSQSERRADDAERELMEWKKIKFMQDRVGEDFHATVLSCTKYGFFVELDDLFIEGLVPIESLSRSLPFGDPDRFVFRDTDRAIVGTHSGRIFKLGQRVHVVLDRIDRPARRLQFALVPTETLAPRPTRKAKTSTENAEIWQKHKAKSLAKKSANSSPDRSGKPAKKRTGKAAKKGKRR